MYCRPLDPIFQGCLKLDDLELLNGDSLQMSCCEERITSLLTFLKGHLLMCGCGKKLLTVI